MSIYKIKVRATSNKYMRKYVNMLIYSFKNVELLSLLCCYKMYFPSKQCINSQLSFPFLLDINFIE